MKPGGANAHFPLPGELSISRLRLLQDVELPIAKARHKNGEIEVVPVVLYPMDLKHDCEFLHQLNPLPEWGKSWREFEKDGDWNDALHPIVNGIKQAIEKARLEAFKRERVRLEVLKRERA